MWKKLSNVEHQAKIYDCYVYVNSGKTHFHMTVTDAYIYTMYVKIHIYVTDICILYTLKNVYEG